MCAKPLSSLEPRGTLILTPAQGGEECQLAPEVGGDDFKGMRQDTTESHGHGRMRSASGRSRVPGEVLWRLRHAQRWASTASEAEFPSQNDDANTGGHAFPRWTISLPSIHPHCYGSSTKRVLTCQIQKKKKNEASKRTCRASHSSWWSSIINTGSCLMATQYE